MTPLLSPGDGIVILVLLGIWVGFCILLGIAIGALIEKRNRRR